MIVVRLCVLSFLFWGCCFSSQALDAVGVNRLASKILGTDNLQTKQNFGNVSIVFSNSGKGFVILSKDSIPRVIGFSKESEWKVEDMPLVLIEWLKNFEGSNKDNFASPLMPMEVKDTIMERASVEPLISTHWHQSSPYNDYAPLITDGNVKTAAGCVAIAGAQITYYWWRDNPKATLRNTPVYPYGGAPVTYSIPKGTPNEWELIQTEYCDDDTHESRDAVARLCYVIGTTSYLNYATSTGGQIDDAAKAMYSQYNLVSDFVYRNNCSQEQWDSLIYNEIVNGRPVLCAGQGLGGHAFVIDGYDSETDLYHFNFGWGGKGDGYYPVDDSEYAMGGYKNNQSMAYNIHPKNRNIQANISIDKDENDSVRLYIDINNCGTLPAKVNLYSNTNVLSNNENDSLLWFTVVDNNNEWIRYSVNVRRNSSAENVLLELSDENKTVLTEITLEAPDPIDRIKSENFYMIYNLNGNKVSGNNINGIYIIKLNGNTKKVLK